MKLEGWRKRCFREMENRDVLKTLGRTRLVELQLQICPESKLKVATGALVQRNRGFFT